MPNLQSLIVPPLLHSVIGRHDLPPVFGEMRKHELPHPDHPDSLDIYKACCRLLALPTPMIPHDFLVADLVVFEVVPLAPSATRVAVSKLGPLLVGDRWLSCPRIPVLFSGSGVGILSDSSSSSPSGVSWLLR